MTDEPIFRFSEDGKPDSRKTSRDYPTDPSLDIEWSAGKTGVSDIQSAFNNARQQENSLLGTSIPMMTLPLQSQWDSMTDGEKMFWLVNKERIDRGVAPLHGLEENVTSVAQYYAGYLIDNDAWGHYEDGRSPWERLESNPAIGDCSDFLNVAENLAVFMTSGSYIPLPIEQSVYNWMYEDGLCCSWGHRHAILWYPYNDNGGTQGMEGFLGVGRASGTYDGWNFAEMIVMNVFDPCSTWDYGTTQPETPTVATTSISNITETGAVTGGSVTSDGGFTVTGRGVCWNTSLNPTTANNKTSDGSGTGNFTSTMSGLSPNTIYFVRAYATNSQGTSYGSQISFITLGGNDNDLNWITTKAAALSAAQSQGKYVLLLAGRESCGYTIHMRDTVCEMNAPAIKNIILDEYVPWFSDVDSSSEWWTYGGGLSVITLPLICRIDPNTPDSYLDRTTGVQDPNVFYTRLLNGISIVGDIDNIAGLDLGDAILALQISTGITGLSVNMAGEVNGDFRIGPEEAIYVLRILSQ